MKLNRSAVAVAAAALLPLAGCSSSGGSAASTPASQAQLRSTLLRSGDLPSEWVGKAHNSADDQDDASDRTTDQQLATCIGVPASEVAKSEKDDALTVHSPDFTKVESTVSSDAEPDSGGTSGFAEKLAQSVLTSGKANTCFEKVLRSSLATSLPAGASIDSLDVDVTKPASGDPDNLRFRFTASIKVSLSGQSLAVYISEVQISDHGASDTVEFEGFAAPVPGEVQQAAITAVSGRVAAL